VSLHSTLPFREAGVDILKPSEVGYPKCCDWRSRSGCAFCSFLQKIEWVRLR
jgi:hypothetical protein